jgi:hypothetical protein
MKKYSSVIYGNSSMNDSYNETVTRNGKIYHYDPDRDIYYAYTEESPASRWSWLIVGGVLAVMCYFTA